MDQLNSILMTLILGLGTVTLFFLKNWFKQVASKQDVSTAQLKTQAYLEKELTDTKLGIDKRFDKVETRVTSLEERRAS